MKVDAIVPEMECRRESTVREGSTAEMDRGRESTLRGGSRLESESAGEKKYPVYPYI